MKFSPLPSPATADPVLVAWVEDNLRSLADTINIADNVEMVKHGALPSKYKDGEVYYFLAGVTGGGAAEGLYCREAGAWTKL